MHMIRAAVIALSFALVPLQAWAEARIALLIGNKDYKSGVGALTNPVNDIRVVGEALKVVGFEVLKPVQNARRADMLRAIHEFANKLKVAGADAVGFLYYSGHGIASAGENYLIPVDVEEPSTVELSVQGVKHSEVLAILRNEAPNAAHYLVLDACRNTLQGARGGKGFVPIGQQSGVLVAFAAEPGKTASDTGQRSGPYAAALAAELVKPDQSDLIMFHHVRVAVMEKTGGDQVPWTEDGIQRRERVQFGGEKTSTQTTGTPAVAPKLSEAAEAWSAIKETSNVAALELFIGRYKNTYFADLARLRIEELKKQQVAVATPPAQQAPTKQPAEPSWWPWSSRPQEPAQQPTQPTANVTPARCDGIEIPVGQSERRCLKPGAGKTEHFKDCPTCPEMVVVPAGAFTMGSPASEPQRGIDEAQVRVTISAPFAVGRYAVTFDEWDACVADGGCNGYKPADGGWGRGKRPVINVSWDDAKAYASWVSRKTGKTYRLLSGTEREYVTRAGTTTPFWWGSSITPKQANYDGSTDPYKGGGSKGEFRQRTVPVDSFEPNPWGLYNVHGNVWEWTEDCWNDRNNGNPGDGSARTTGDCSGRVVRGGSWVGLPLFLRSAFRVRSSTDVRDVIDGFRLARTLGP
jgi:formylglycine-generating enzyme required for sulfatase activity